MRVMTQSKKKSNSKLTNGSQANGNPSSHHHKGGDAHQELRIATIAALNQQMRGQLLLGYSFIVDNCT